jgi:solute carrier family 25 S-adenosylmethionine transporter 26
MFSAPSHAPSRCNL